MLSQVLKIAVLPAWELTFRELRSPISLDFQTPFLVGPRVTFGSLLGGPGVTLGGLLVIFGILWGVLGALVRIFWVPLARLGCLWAPSLCTQGRRGGRSLRSFVYVLCVCFVVMCLFFAVFHLFLHMVRSSGTIWDGVGVWFDNVSATLFFQTRFQPGFGNMCF